MTETYAFKKASNSVYTGADTLTFKTLFDEYGMYLRSVTDTATSNSNIAKVDSPFDNNVKVTNKATQPRTITIEFGYTGKLPPFVGDQALFEFLGTALNATYVPFNAPSMSDSLSSPSWNYDQTQKITLKKTWGDEDDTLLNRYIDGVIQSVVHAVYEEEPTLQITMITDAYWRGEEEKVDITNKLGLVGSFFTEYYRYAFTTVTTGTDVNGNEEIRGLRFKGEVAAPYNIIAEYSRGTGESFDVYLRFDLFGHFGVHHTCDFSNNASKDSIYALNGEDLKVYAFQTRSGSLTNRRNLITKIDSGTTLTRLFPNIDLSHEQSRYQLWMDANSKARFDNNQLKFYIQYSPLYIR